MATFNNSSADVRFDNTGGTLTDFSTATMNVSLNITRDSSQYGTLGNAFKSGTAGKRMGSGQIVVPMDTSTSSAFYNLREQMLDTTYGAAFTLQVSQPDANTGSLQISSEIIITSMDMSASGDSGDVAQATFNFITDGTISESVIA